MCLEALQKEYERLQKQLTTLDTVPPNIPLPDEYFQTRAYLEQQISTLEQQITQYAA